MASGGFQLPEGQPQPGWDEEAPLDCNDVAAGMRPLNVEAAIRDLLATMELSGCSIRKFRYQVAANLGLGEHGLEDEAEKVNAMIKRAVEELPKQPETPAQRMANIIADLCPEN